MSSASMAVPSSSIIPTIVHLFAHPVQAETPAQTHFSRRRRAAVEPGSRAAACRRSEPLTPAHPRARGPNNHPDPGPRPGPERHR
jgi:hypothetical protein